MIGIGVIGANGRMGRAIRDVLENHEPAHFVGGADKDHPIAGLARDADVLIDFSVPDALAGNLQAAITAGKPIVVGTTGLGEAHQALIDAAGAQVPVVQSANMSLGVNLLAHLVREAAARLGTEWDIEIVEMHHRHKRDAPSGTALLLGAAAAAGRGHPLAQLRAAPHDGDTGPRTEGEIGFAVLRGGSVAGDHQVVLAAEGERIELGHRAESRAIFARGAVAAAAWVVGKAPGRYTMTDVLSL